MEIEEKKEIKPIEEKSEAERWHFWFAVSFSFFLVITFVYYLPLRFQFNALHEEDEHMMEESAMMMNGDDHGGHGTYVTHEEEDVVEGLVVNFVAKPTLANAGATTTLSFFVNEKPSNIPIPISRLEVEHEKLMHVIGVRSNMNEFFHVHPLPSCEEINLSDDQIEAVVSGAIDSVKNPWGNTEDFESLMEETEKNLGCMLDGEEGTFSVKHTFAKPGTYKIWSEIKKDGVIHAFGHSKLFVEGEGRTSDKQVSFKRSTAVGEYQVFLQHGALRKGVPSSLSFDVHNVLAEDLMLENYLGAQMHLAIIKDDLTQFIHTHPKGDHDDTATDHHVLRDIFSIARAHTDDEPASPVVSTHEESIEFTTVFPEAGLYKAFAQFRPAGVDLPPDEALVAEFWIEVKDEASFPVSPWWMLLIVSSVMIVILSKYVKRYIGEEL